LLGKIAEIKKAKVAVGDENADGTCILGGVNGGRGFGSTVRIRFSNAGQWTRDVISRRAQHSNFNALDRKRPSRLDDDVSVSSDRLLVRGVIGARNGRVFEVWPVVNKRAYLDSVQELGNAANVVAMVMSNQDVIELRNAGLMGGRQDPVGVTPFISGPTGIDEQ
jgi:hypothetical protein